MLKRNLTLLIIAGALIFTTSISTMEVANADITVEEPFWQQGHYWKYVVYAVDDLGVNVEIATANISVMGSESILLKNETYSCDLLSISIYTEIKDEIIEENGIFYYLENSRMLIKFAFFSPVKNYTVVYEKPINATPSPLFVHGAGDVGFFIDYPISTDKASEDFSKNFNITISPPFLQPQIPGENYSSSEENLICKTELVNTNKTIETIFGPLQCYEIVQAYSTSKDTRYFVFSESFGLMPIQVTSKNYKTILTEHHYKKIENNPPKASDNIVNITTKTAYIFSESDFKYSDPDGDSFNKIKIINMYGANGTLTLNSTEIMAGQEINTSDISADKLVFTPDKDTNESYYAFQFKIHDGSIYSISTYTMTIHITNKINDENEVTPGFTVFLLAGAIFTIIIYQIKKKE